MKGKMFNIFVILNLILTSLFLVFTSVPSTVGTDKDLETHDNGLLNSVHDTLTAIPITNATELQNMSANLSANYYLANDIDCNDTMNWDSGAGFKPIGILLKIFSGSFDGKGYNIINLTINRSATDHVGLFGVISHNSTIKNVNLINANILGRNDVGCLAGRIYGNVSNCHASGSLTGVVNVGGLIGNSLNANITNSSTDVLVTSNKGYIGGLIGKMSLSSIENCYTNGNVGTISYNVGGLVGHASIQCRINNSYATGDVKCQSGTAGGLCGYIVDTNISYCFATGDVSGGPGGDDYLGGLIGESSKVDINFSYATGTVSMGYDYVGGFIGTAYTTTINNSYATGAVQGLSYEIGGFAGDSGASIFNCYSTGSVTGNDETGGFIGYCSSTTPIVKNCYSTGLVTANTNVGGFIGYNSGTNIVGNFFDNITSGYTKAVGFGSSTGIFGNFTSIMKTRSTFINVSWDFVNIWGIIENTSYPFLWVFYSLPTVATQAIPTATEDSFYTTLVSANLSDYPVGLAVKEWKISSNSGSWLSIDNSGTISGTPTNDNVGDFWLKVMVKDSVDNTDFKNLDIIILNTNDPPEIQTAHVNSATEDMHYYTNYSAIDIDPTMDNLTWNLTTSADWLKINSTTGNLTGVPRNTDVGKYLVVISVEDGNGGSDESNFFLMVQNVNDDPIITTTDVIEEATEDKLYIMDFDSLDPDPTDDTLTWAVDSNGNWFDFNLSTGVLYGTPTNADVGSTWINISISDDKGGQSWLYYDLEVLNVNDPPVITTTDLTMAKGNEYYHNDYNATDIDPVGDILIWSLETNATSWLKINSTTGLLSGKPTNDDVGIYWVMVSVSDGKGGEDDQTFELNVLPGLPANKPPVITTSNIITVAVNKTYSVDYDAIDDNTSADKLVWSLETNADWLSINSSTGVLSGIPKKRHKGDFWVIVKVSDDEGGISNKNFTLTVYLKANEPPLITTEDVTEIKAGQLYSVNYEAVDDRTPQDLLEWLMFSNATWLGLDPVLGIMSGEPNSLDVGQYWVNVTVLDGDHGSDYHNFTITVLPDIPVVPPNNKPQLSNGKLTPSSGDTETEFTFTITYTDKDNDVGEVYIWIDGEKRRMIPDLSDSNFTDGVKYEYITELSWGDHDYYFTATDGFDSAESVDDSPIDTDTARSTPHVSKHDIDIGEEEFSSMIIIGYIILFIIIIILVAIIFMKSKKLEESQEKTEEAMDELEEEMDELEDDIDEEENELEEMVELDEDDEELEELEELDEMDELECDEEFDELEASIEKKLQDDELEE